jgi:preprotein translocase subunit SecA
MLGYIAKKVFGTRNERVLKTLRPLVDRVNQLESSYLSLSDDEIRGCTASFKERLSRGESLESLEPEAFALVREASKRALGLRHYDVQIVGGGILHRGMITEMKTGEGKTLVATLPAYLNALSGEGVHVVTVNDYLAKRDAEWMGKLYSFLGLSVGVVVPSISEQVRKSAYEADITYGQNNEFGFDYLRDNMKYALEDMAQRGHHFAIVDEVDSILIDEARTPLIISGPADDPTEKYVLINKIIPHLERDKDYEIDLRSKNPLLTEQGISKSEKLLGIDNLYDPTHVSILHHVNQALKAHVTLVKDVDYMIKDDQIIIVDEFTGRLMTGRRWSNGLHQAVEAKEGLEVMRENQTLASITFQNYFRMYKKLAGMTGTADTEAAEFKEIYRLDVVVAPPNKTLARQDLGDVVFRTRKEKYEAVINEIVELNNKRQPVLVGTVSIEQSELLSHLLTQKGVTHNVLNAKAHEKEAEIVAQAGRLSAVTISTNMAGRGTDILLGGNPEFLAYAETGLRDEHDPLFRDALEKYRAQCLKEKEEVRAKGGLAIIGTERHESRRIDNQLRGRAGRQGDQGQSQFFVSLEDDLMLRFGGERLQYLMSRMGWEEGVAMDGRTITHSIRIAQTRVEAMHFESRKHVTEYDDVMNKQRQVIYELRHKILRGEEIRDEVLSMLDDVLEELIVATCDARQRPMEWSIDGLKERFKFLTNHELALADQTVLSHQTLFDSCREAGRILYVALAEERERKLEELIEYSSREESVLQFNSEVPSYSVLEQRALLEGVDYFWNAHLQNMDELREGIGLRGYGQKNPLYEYQKEGFAIFQEMLSGLRTAVVRRLFYEEVVDLQSILEMVAEEEMRREERERSITASHEATLADAHESEPDHDKVTVSQTQNRSEALRKERRKHKK